MVSSHKKEVEDIVAEVKAKGLLYSGVMYKILELLHRMARDLDRLNDPHCRAGHYD